MSYPATDFASAVGLTITASNQLHEIVNGDAEDLISTDSGEIPSLRKVLKDNFYFAAPIDWVVGEDETSFNQLRKFTDGTIWSAPTATAGSPVEMTSDPYSNAAWEWSVFNAEGSEVVLQPRQTGDGVQTVFSAPNTEATTSANLFTVTKDGLRQRPDTDYQVTGVGEITFTEAPEEGVEVDILYIKAVLRELSLAADTNLTQGFVTPTGYTLERLGDSLGTIKDDIANFTKELIGIETVEYSDNEDLYPLIGKGLKVSGVGFWMVPSRLKDGSPLPDPAILDSEPSGTEVTVNGGVEVTLIRVKTVPSVKEISSQEYSVGDIVKAEKYYPEGSPVDGLVYLVEDPLAADGFRNHNDSAGNFLRLMSDSAVDLTQCGAVKGTDVTPILSGLDSSGGGTFKYHSEKDDDALLINSHTFVNKFSLICSGNGVHFKPVSPSSNVFNLDGAGSELIGVIFDYSNTTSNKHWTAVSFNADSCKCNIEVRNLKAPSSNEDTAVSALKMRSSSGVAAVKGSNLVNTGNSNGSLPHLVDVQNDAVDNTITSAVCEVGVAGVVCANSKTTIIKSLILRGMEDNGLYTLGGAVNCQCDQMYYEGNEEPVVDKGKDTLIDNLTIENQVFAVGIDDNKTPLQINSLKLLVSDEAKVKAARSSVVQSRNSNTSCAGVIVNSLKGVTYGDRLLGFTDGVVETVKVRDLDVTHVYHDPAQLKTIVGHSLGNKVSYENWDLVIKDETSSLSSSDSFTMQVPFVLSEYSSWKNVKVTCPDGDYVFRGINCIQDSMLITDATVQFVGQNIYVREVPSLRLGQKRLYSTSKPTSGSWLRGDEVLRPNPVAGGYRGWIAVSDIADASIDNSDFKEFGDIQS